MIDKNQHFRFHRKKSVVLRNIRGVANQRHSVVVVVAGANIFPEDLLLLQIWKSADEPTHSKSGGQVENYKEKRFQYSSRNHFRTTYFIIWLLAQALMT